MSLRFPRCRPFAPRRNYFLAIICAVLASLVSRALAAAPGQLDPTFGGGFGYVVTPIAQRAYPARIAIASDKKIVAVGSCFDGAGSVFCIARYNEDGALDLAFGANGKVIAPFPIGTGGDTASSVLVQPDGKVIVIGTCNSDGRIDFCVARYSANGTVDSGFGANGHVATSVGTGQPSTRQAALQSDGKIIVSGVCNNGALLVFCLVRFTEYGALDLTFGGDGKVLTQFLGRDFGSGVALQADGKILQSGSCINGAARFDFCISRYNIDGSLDAGFGVNGKVLFSVGNEDDYGRVIAVQSDGKLVVAGSCTNGTGAYLTDDDFCLVRLHTNGALDLSFGVNGKVITDIPNSDDLVRGIGLQGDGKIVIGGNCSQDSPDKFCLARYSPNGELDVSFNSGRVVTLISTSSYGTDLALQPDGRILLFGNCALYGPTPTGGFCLARYEADPYKAKSCGLNIDDNITLSASTDAILVVRYLLGLRGDALTAGALGENPTRTGQALENYLNSLNLDADGDGEALAMTDGLLMLRAMLGLTGTALTQGATNAAHPNVRNAQQILTWIENTHGVACLP